MLGDEAQQQVGLPLAPFAIVPSHAVGEQPHVSRELHFGVRRYELLPFPAEAVHAAVVSVLRFGVRHHRAGNAGGASGGVFCGGRLIGIYRVGIEDGAVAGALCDGRLTWLYRADRAGILGGNGLRGKVAAAGRK
ncbi:hypothetical protein HMPREF1981_02845 [Bacteroides pyogenes F0041]|uniref:Uncharacterized protein n=1 Tax=Bacteroides pyogenes F0041 TaxID=1321819 RepID=U2CD10_9BACE|nr:hypothetical protein HMPREF1981_02845 [Bacteroides pyogenes F0041]